MEDLLERLLSHRLTAWCSLASIEFELETARASRLVRAVLSQLSLSLGRRATTVGELRRLGERTDAWAAVDPIRVADRALLAEDHAERAVRRLVPVVRRDLARILERLPPDRSLASLARRIDR